MLGKIKEFFKNKTPGCKACDKADRECKKCKRRESLERLG
jgi:hypothetical protein